MYYEICIYGYFLQGKALLELLLAQKKRGSEKPPLY